MNLYCFFEHYTSIGITNNKDKENSFFELWVKEINHLNNMIPDLPFSNIWVAEKLHSILPKNSTLHLGILNSLRSWNFFDIDPTIQAISNVGGFGIDGNLSSLIGASLSSPNKLFFGIFGDLAFFYDLNSLGNREIRTNLRIILINNGTGTEFKNSNHRASKFNSDKFVAANGHFGNKSRTLVKNFSENLGFEYYGCDDKIQFEAISDYFTSSKIGEKSIIIELFINEIDERLALENVTQLILPKVSTSAKQLVTKTIGVDNSDKIKRLIRRGK
jgi:2-succinyl-5-enolpyruvyl-6-hydroxy-3-cyclohexene-1-carboxylate synthase